MLISRNRTSQRCRFQATAKLRCRQGRSKFALCDCLSLKSGIKYDFRKLCGDEDLRKAYYRLKSNLEIQRDFLTENKPNLKTRKLVSIWRLLRPYQWVKNAFVFVGLIFSESFSDFELVLKVILVALAFSLVSSAVYVLNDWFDREKDRLHPKKCHRPLAAGNLSSIEALAVLGVLLLPGLAIGFSVSVAVGGILLLYLLQNLAYSRGLKNIVVLDVFLLALGFMLRILAGTSGVGITPSNWLLLCGLMLALFMGFGKRWAELNEFQEEAPQQRAVLQNYSQELLDKMIGITAGGVIVTYSLYTVDDQIVALHGSNLIYTVPFVLYGVFRYLYLLHECGAGEDPSHLVVKDPHIVAVVFLWLISVVWVLAG